MISVQTVVSRMESVLDAESSDRYTFERDFKSAINSSVEWLQAVFNRAFADKKLTEEDLKELVKVAVFQTNQFSRFYLDHVDDSIWSVLRINPEPTLHPSGAVITSLSSPEDSLWRNDLSYIKSSFSAKRLSLEQWEEGSDNIFEAGNSTILNSFKDYAYLNYVDYRSSNYVVPGPEIEIRPDISNSFVGITYLKYPTPVALVTDSIELPKSLINLVYEKALSFVSWKQGDQTNLYGVSEKDINTLVRLMM